MATETMVIVRAVTGSLVISWMPDMMIDANIMTAAPPRTGWGIIETTAASFGSSPQSTRKQAPMPMQKRLTILVIVISPTFWANEVFGSTPKIEAREEPSPSHMTAPRSSRSEGSRPRPPSVMAEVSPTVSTAETINMMHIGMMAVSSKCISTGRKWGSENQDASATTLQSSTQAAVWVTPPAST